MTVKLVGQPDPEGYLHLVESGLKRFRLTADPSALQFVISGAFGLLTEQRSEGEADLLVMKIIAGISNERRRSKLKNND